MSVQVPLFEKGDKKASKVAAKVEEIVGEGFDVKILTANFGVLCEATGGVENLRQLLLQLAFQGRFTATGPRSLVAAVLDGTHAPLAPAKGREATSVTVAGGAALAVGPAPMMIPEGWRWVPLLSIARLESGHTPSRNHPDYWNGGIPWIGIRDAKANNYRWIETTEQTISQNGLDNSSARLLPAGTVCLSRTASVGYVTIMKREMATSQDFVNWVCGEQLLPEFLMQLLRCEVPVLRRFSKGAVHQTIYFPEVKAFHVSLPPLAEQKRIVAKVDQLMALCDELEAKQTKKRETGARLTKAALDALTSAEGPDEFDAAWKRVVENFDVLIDRAEKVGELRGAIVSLALRGKLCQGSEGDALSELRGQPEVVPEGKRPHPVPRNWAWLYLDQLVESITDGDHQPPPKAAAGVAFLTIGNVSSGRLDFSETRFVSRDYFEKLDRRRVPAKGDILYTVVGATYGRPVKVQTDREFCVQRHIAILRPDGSCDSDYLYAFLGSADAYAQATKAITGTAQPTVALRPLRRFLVPLPPKAEQRAIVTRLEQLMKVCDDLEAKLRQAEDRAAKLVEAVVRELVA